MAILSVSPAFSISSFSSNFLLVIYEALMAPGKNC